MVSWKSQVIRYIMFARVSFTATQPNKNMILCTHVYVLNYLNANIYTQYKNNDKKSKTQSIILKWILNKM